MQSAVLVSAVIALALAGIGFVGVYLGLASPAEHALLVDRLDKLERQPFNARLGLVGDSSLGNSIDEVTFSQLTGLPALNLALTGSYGFVGTANMIERVAAKSGVDTIMVVQALDIITRQSSAIGDLETRPLRERGPRHWLVFVQAYFEFFNWKIIGATLKGLLSGTSEAEGKADLVNDYIKQSGNRKNLEHEIAMVERRPFAVADIDGNAKASLRRVGEVCRKLGIRCIYAHGPIYAEVCVNSAAFIAELDRLIVDSGLELLSGTPFCVEENKLGDAVDHIRPEWKEEITRRYVELLRPRLLAASGS